MEDTVTEYNKALDILIMELWMFADDIHCQASHGPDTSPTCTHTVVARKRVACNGKDFLICQNSYNWNLDLITSKNTLCHCGANLEDCWTVTPI